jgi:hypothetical protein
MADQSNIDADLTRRLEAASDRDELEVLVYGDREHGLDELEAYLGVKAEDGLLRYNRLPMADTIVVRAPKGVIREIAARRDVSRIAANPTFGI